MLCPFFAGGPCAKLKGRVFPGNLPFSSQSLGRPAPVVHSTSMYQMTLNYDVLPSDWSNLVSTFIDGGVGREWWRLVEVQRFKPFKNTTLHQAGRWFPANYGDDSTYADGVRWRIVLHTYKHDLGLRCFDGTRWGWKEGDLIKARYDLEAYNFQLAARFNPQLFMSWLESGERNLSSHFDAPAADSIMQLVAFGVEVFA